MTSGSADEGIRLKPRPPMEAWIYKKIDSTLRGHPGEELAALMRTLNATRAVVAPAFPAQGRATIDARQLVNGQPLAQTPFGAEAGNDDLHAVFSGHGYPVHALGLDDMRGGNSQLVHRLAELYGIIVADAETDADLTALAIAAQDCGISVWCGSAGLAHALSRVVQEGASHGEVIRPHGPVLVIAGSRNPVTLRQIEVACEHGGYMIPVPTELRAGASPAPTDVARLTAAHIRVGHDVIVTTSGLAESVLGKSAIANGLGAVAAAVVAQCVPGVLVLTGGDIATAVCTALGAHAIELCGELQPGIAFGRLADGPYAGLSVVTKAGGFGRAESLWEIIRGIGD